MSFLKNFLKNFYWKKYLLLLNKPLSELNLNKAISITPEKNVMQAATRMIANNISSLLVIDNNNLLGIITVRDYFLKLPANIKAAEKKVKDIMTKKLYLIDANKTINEAYSLMRKNHFRRIIIKKNKDYYIFTQTDFLRLFYKKLFPFSFNVKALSFMKKPLFIHSDDNLNKIRNLMKENNTGELIVLNKFKEPIGLLTEHDYLSQFYDTGGIFNISYANELKSPNILLISKDISLGKAIYLLFKYNIRRLPIFDNGKIIGVATQRTISEKIQDILLDEPKLELLSFFKKPSSKQLDEKKIYFY